MNQVQTTLNDTKKSVSDGKSGIASAITEKGVTTAADATFQVMKDNIISMAIQQYNSGYGTGYVDGQKSINTNAKVTYVRHYHTGSSTTGGGCYTVHNIHHHTGNPTNGGGCYTTPNYRNDPIYASCPNNGGWHKDPNWEWGSKDANKDRKYKGICNVCGAHYDSYSSWSSFPVHTSLIPTSYNKVLTGYSLTCGYIEGQNLGWSLGCGHEDGQILSATITY